MVIALGFYYVLRYIVLRVTIDGMTNTLGEPAALILLSLTDGARHGYAITEDIADQVGVRLGPGTLYGALTRLEERGLIVALPKDDRRQPYGITEEGRAALTTHLAQMRRVVDTGQARLGLA